MTSRDFCYWLQGYLELRGSVIGMTDAQVESITKHLAMVFKHEIDPAMPNPELDAVHNPYNPTFRC